MDRSEQSQSQPPQTQQQAVTTVVAGTGPIPFSTIPYQTFTMGASGNPSQPPATHSNTPHQITYRQPQHLHQQQQQLQMFWANQMHEIEQTVDFKNHSLPLARIKKIMKADEDVRMISSEAPVIFARACEIFIMELTLRSWIHTEENKRRTLQKNDIAAAISRTDIFDFLVDIVPRDDLKEEGLGVAPATLPLGGSADVPYFVPPHYMVPPGVIMTPPADQAPAYGAQQPSPPVVFRPWPQTHQLDQQQQPQQQQNDT